MSSFPIKFGLVSPSRWGRLLLDNIQDSSKLKLQGVTSRNLDTAKDVAQQYGGKAYDNYDSMLADPDLDAVVLPTPHFLHHPQTIAALKAGKHVFVEKPMANTVAQAEEMKALAEEKGLVLAVGLQGRRCGGFIKAKEMIDSGELGQIVMIVVTHGAPLTLNYTDDDWETKKDYIPGGPLDNLGVHYGDVLPFLFGPVKRVSGMVSSSITPFDAPDASISNIEFQSGALCVYTVQQVSAYSSRMSVFGTKGVLHIHRFAQELEWQDLVDTQAAKKEGPTLRSIPFDGPNAFSTALRAELEDFADCVVSGNKPLVNADNGIESLRLMRLIMESSERNITINLE